MERPKLGDSEDELIKFQEEFLASKKSPSATFIRKGDKRKSADGTHQDRDVISMDTLPPVVPTLHVQPEPAKKSRFRSSREKGLPTGPLEKVCQPQTADIDPEELIDKHDTGLAAVLSSIIERDTSRSVFCEPLRATQAFPTVLKQSSFAKPTVGGKSLFAQLVEQKGLQEFGVMVQQETDRMDTTALPSLECGSPRLFASKQAVVPGTDKSHIVDGRGLSASEAEKEASRIHKENLIKLSEMTEEEILDEQQQLMQVLDPSIVAFLKSKARSKHSTPGKPAPKPARQKPKPSPEKMNENSHELPSDVPLESKGKWVHMDKIEYDKLEWMTDLPQPSADDIKTGQQARFDFHGYLIPADANIPTNVGLHHHGDESERAGYSVGELFQLARSTNVQQRVLALNTLANVFSKAKAGFLDGLIQNPIIPSVLDAGVVFLLRWACDDSVDSVMAAAVSALNALLCNPADEAALDTALVWHQGCCVPALTPRATLLQQAQERKDVDEENKEQESDADVARRDLVQGLVTRMLLVERLQYILEVRRPQAPTVIAILQILTRVARHCTQLAYELSRNIKLMDLIVSRFLPTSWDIQGELTKSSGVSIVYGRPLAAAMRLVGSLCQAGRHISASLLSSCSLNRVIVRYLAVGTEQLQLSHLEAISLQLESLRTWKILLSYGLAVDIYMDLYESITGHLQIVVLPMLLHLNEQELPSDRDVGLISTLETVLPVASLRPVKPTFNTEDGVKTERPVMESTSWKCVEGLLPLVRLCCEKGLAHIAEHYTQQKPDLQFFTACLNFLATFYIKCEGQTSVPVVDFLQQVENFSLCCLQPFLGSWGFQSILAQLFGASNLLSASADKRREVSGCLPELGCDSRESVVPVMRPSSPAGFLLALLRLVYALCRVHKGVIAQTAQEVLHHEDIVNYIRRVTLAPMSHLQSNHFTRFENLIHYYLIKLATLLDTVPHPSIVHQLALDLLGRLHEGDEFLAHDLLSGVLFNADFIPEGREEELASDLMAEMKLSDSLILKSASKEEINTSSSQLLREAYRSLAVIRAHYFKAFAHMEEKVAKSKSLLLQMPESIASLLTPGYENYLMPRDWVFWPLVELYNLSTTVELSKDTYFNIAAFVPLVTSVVQWIFMLETWRKHSLAGVSVALKISRLMCIFLAGDDRLFMDKSVYGYLACLFRTYTMSPILDKLDFDQPVPGISSFYDLYTLFLDQYEAVSFGDPLFAAYTLLPMQQCQSCMLRRAVWQEHDKVLRSMPLPVGEMLLSIERFLTPDETDISLIQLYAGSLINGLVQPTRSPVLFLVAVHHLNRFLYFIQDQNNSTVRQKLWERVLNCKDQKLKEMIIRYKQASPEAANGMELYESLPTHRQTVLTQNKERLKL